MSSYTREVRNTVQNLKRNLDTYPDAAAQEGLKEVEREAQRNIVEQDAVASTDLYRAFDRRWEPHSDGTRHVLANTAAHAQMVESGTGEKGIDLPYTRAFGAPAMSARLVDEIRQWLYVKPTAQPQHSRGRSAVLISLAISGNLEDHLSGTSAQPFFGPAWWRKELEVKHDLENSVAKSVRRA